MNTYSSTTNSNQSTLTLEKMLDAKRKLDEVPAIPFRNPNIFSSEIVPPDFTHVNLPRWSSNRSKRLWKKLMKRTKKSRANGYNKVWCIMGKLYAHPTVINEIRKATL